MPVNKSLILPVWETFFFAAYLIKHLFQGENISRSCDYAAGIASLKIKGGYVPSSDLNLEAVR